MADLDRVREALADTLMAFADRDKTLAPLVRKAIDRVFSVSTAEQVCELLEDFADEVRGYQPRLRTRKTTG